MVYAPVVDLAPATLVLVSLRGSHDPLVTAFGRTAVAVARELIALVPGATPAAGTAVRDGRAGRVEPA